jgi:hypothetical protein
MNRMADARINIQNITTRGKKSEVRIQKQNRIEITAEV